jgi:hypothetical protein
LNALIARQRPDTAHLRSDDAIRAQPTTPQLAKD